MPLTGQSIALLNAFKRQPSGSQQSPMQSHVQSQQNLHVAETLTMSAVGAPAQNLPPPPPYSQYPAQKQQQSPRAAILNQAMPLQPQFIPPIQPQQQQLPLPPQQPPISMRNPPPANDQHRNALLGMFKKAGGPQSPAAHSSQQAQPPSPLGFVAELSSPSQRKPSSEAPVELGIGNLSIQPLPGNNHAQHRRKPSPAQQRSNTLAAAPHGGVSLPYASYAAQSHRPQQPSPLAQPSAPAPAPVGTDQKRQLLSLFGGGAGAGAGSKPAVLQLQARSPLGGTIHEMGNGNPAPREASRSRLASLASTGVPGEPSSGSVSRRGSQTPISPADESFLLGYLQSVTNTASR